MRALSIIWRALGCPLGAHRDHRVGSAPGLAGRRDIYACASCGRLADADGRRLR